MSQSSAKIAYLMSRFPKLTETFVLYEMLELQRMNFQVVVFPLRLEKSARAHPEVSEVREVIFPAPWCSWNTLAINLKWWLRHPGRMAGTWFRALATTAGSVKFFCGVLAYFPKAVVFTDQAQQLEISHVHAHFSSHPAMAAWVMHQLCGISYSFTAHGTDLHVDQKMLREKVRDAAFAVTVSEYNRRFIEAECGAETASRFEVLRCGADLSRFMPRPSPRTGDLFEILCVASFREVKGHPFLIDACALLRDRGIPFRCRLIGSGPKEAAIRRQVRALGLEKFVIVEGEKTRPEVIEALGEADVIVLSSIQIPSGSREGIPVALMEGMACGLPVVASRISGIPELVEEGVSGLLFEPGRSVEAADALERLASDSELCVRMGECARARVEEDFDLVKNGKRLAERIREVLQLAHEEA